MADPTLTPPARRRLPYQQVVDRIESQIRAKRFQPGDRLPPLKELSQEYGFNYATVRKGLMALRDRGLINIRHGVGVFINEPPAPIAKPSLRIAMALRDYLLQTDDHHPFTGTLLAGVYTARTSPRYQIDVLPYAKDSFAQRIGPALLEHRYPGVLIPGGSLLPDDYQFLKNHQIPFVQTMWVPSDRPDDWGYWIVLDHIAALRRSLEHLHALGHRRIALLQYVHMGLYDTTVGHFRRFACDLGLEDSEKLLVRINNPHEGVQWQDIDQLFQLQPQPSAVIVHDEILAELLLAECQRRRIDIPHALAVVCLQDLLPGAHRIPLTACFGVQDIRGIHQAALELLANVLHSQPPAERVQTLPPSLVIKASSGSIRAPDSASAYR